MKNLIFGGTLFFCVGCNFNPEPNNESEITVEVELFDNGKVHHQGSLLNGKREGKHTWFYENGVLHIEAFYQDNVQSGPMKQFYETGEIKYYGNFDGGKEIDTSIFFRMDGSIELYEIFDEYGVLIEKQFFSDKKKLTSESNFVIVYFDSEPVLNTWINYDEKGDTIKSSSNYYTLISPQEEYSANTFSELEIEYCLPLKKNHRVIYGKMNKDYSFLESEVKILEIKGSRIKIPLNTSQIGKNELRFIIEGYDLVIDSLERSNQIYGLFEYVVL